MTPELEGAGQAVAFDAGDDLVGEVHLHRWRAGKIDADGQISSASPRSRQDLRRAAPVEHLHAEFQDEIEDSATGK